MLYFAAIADLIGKKEEQLALPADSYTVAQVVEALVARHPALEGRLAGVRVAQNEAFTTDDAVVSSGDTLALIPPVSGG